MLGEGCKKNNQLETMLNSIEILMKENGYKTLRLSKTKKHSTSAYDCLVLRNCEGKEYKITFDESMQPGERKGEPDYNNWKSTNYITEMKFYEFKEFGYYALIGAETEEEAIEYYNETVSDIQEEDGAPNEINKDEAKIKLFNSTDDEEERTKFIKEFDLCTSTVEPYLILIDGSLV